MGNLFMPIVYELICLASSILFSFLAWVAIGLLLSEDFMPLASRVSEHIIKLSFLWEN